MKTLTLLKSLCCVVLCTLIMASCKDSEPYITYDVTVQLKYPDGYSPAADVVVIMTNTLAKTSFESKTDASGKATFVLSAGAYEAMASEKRAENYSYLLFNGNKASILISGGWNESVPVEIVIKEVYNGGCQKDADAGHYQYILNTRSEERRV